MKERSWEDVGTKVGGRSFLRRVKGSWKRKLDGNKHMQGKWMDRSTGFSKNSSQVSLMKFQKSKERVNVTLK